MEFVNLGKSGLKGSRLCLGMMISGDSQWRKWVLGGDQVLPFVQHALAWLLNTPRITAAIIGTSKLDHLDQAPAALEVKLTPAEIQRLEEHDQPRPVLGYS